MTLDFECHYCGHKWDHTYYYMPQPENLECPKCHDHNLKVRQRAEHDKIDYYAAAPHSTKRRPSNVL